MVGTVVSVNNLTCGINGMSRYVGVHSASPYLFFGSIDGDHRHRSLVTSITSKGLSCLNGETISNSDITYLYGDSECLVSSVNSHAFSNCENLLEVKLPNDIKLNNHSFQYCLNLSSVELPNAIVIGDFSFRRCTNLTSINLLNTTNISGKYAFSECYKLSSIDFPNATNIGERAFDRCINLSSINIQNAVVIGAQAFYSCTKLVSVDISNKTMDEVKSMENYPWDAKSGCIIKCKDGDITIS